MNMAEQAAHSTPGKWRLSSLGTPNNSCIVDQHRYKEGEKLTNATRKAKAALVASVPGPQSTRGSKAA